jgi:ATP-binding cassette subfamily F protein 3
LKEVEGALEKLAREDALIEKRLSDPGTYARFKPEDIAWANTRRAAIAKEVAVLEEEWLDLSARLEAA